MIRPRDSIVLTASRNGATYRKFSATWEFHTALVMAAVELRYALPRLAAVKEALGEIW